MHLMEKFCLWPKKEPATLRPPSKKSNSATHFCKICFAEISNFGWSYFTSEPPICEKCFSEMQPKETVFSVGRFQARTFYEYTERIRSLLYQFKACNDIELASVFFAKQACLLKNIYHGYTLVPAPSYRDKDNRRGFNHVTEMFRCLGLPFIDALVKTQDVKQANNNYEERLNIYRHISFCETTVVRGLSILFVDDLITTGSTAKACCELLANQGAKKIRILAMGHTPINRDKPNDKPP